MPLNGRRPIDLLGQKFGRLTVVDPDLRRVGHGGRWVCVCECGKERSVTAASLRRGTTKSCGCYKKGHTGIKHGLFGTKRYNMWNCAKKRALKKNILFDLKVKDMPEIPQSCPILGMKLEHGIGVGGMKPNSPTLDKIIPGKGYVVGNIQIISQRANVIKNDASPEEIMKVAKYMRDLHAKV